MAGKLDVLSIVLVFGACAALGLGLFRLAERAELWGLYWVVTGVLALSTARERERFFAGR